MAETKKKNLQSDSSSSSEEEVESLPPHSSLPTTGLKSTVSKHADDGSKPNLSPPPMSKPVKRPTEATADRVSKKSKTPGEEKGKKPEAWNSSEEHSSVNFIGKASVAIGLDEALVAAGLRLCSEDLKSEIEKKWRKLHAAESHLLIQKLDLACEESEMITAALRSASGWL